MHFARIGAFIAVSVITGPRHNLLQLRLGAAERGEPACTRLPAVGGCTHAPLDEREIVRQVLAGVAQANARVGCAHEVAHIRYVANDTPPESIYAVLAEKLVEHLERGGEFVSASEEKI